eukprot:TRINITY_DN20167_c0_g1_i1.p1 TRINITY_DN20167_c0_g1~~TRINITY_DN20167_c0_g1_i1.p1  ORF type:complete len:104 (+),score=0.87 TRINITY_DN20167_c0_g1_i1:99-410(+)
MSEIFMVMLAAVISCFFLFPSPNPLLLFSFFPDSPDLKFLFFHIKTLRSDSQTSPFAPPSLFYFSELSLTCTQLSLSCKWFSAKCSESADVRSSVVNVEKTRA